jgi:hypothetical protein
MMKKRRRRKMHLYEMKYAFAATHMKILYVSRITDFLMKRLLMLNPTENLCIL